MSEVIVELMSYSWRGGMERGLNHLLTYRYVAATSVALRLPGHEIAAQSVTAYASTTAKELLLALFKKYSVHLYESFLT